MRACGAAKGHFMAFKAWMTGFALVVVITALVVGKGVSIDTFNFNVVIENNVNDGE